MTKAEKYFIVRTIENLIEQEKRVCEQYCEINYLDRERRERDRDLIIYAYSRALSSLTE